MNDMAGVKYTYVEIHDDNMSSLNELFGFFYCDLSFLLVRTNLGLFPGIITS